MIYREVIDKYQTEYFTEELKKVGVELTDMQLWQFLRFYELLMEYNKVMNLTAITEYKEVLLKHFVDSVSIKKYVTDEVNSVIDMGTGAGFPGIPLKIIFPDIRFVLADSLNKRIKFINTVIDELSLNKIGTVHGRAEDLAKDNLHREKYDLCVSRAVANLSTLSEYCLPFVKVGGQFISYKSDKAEEEISFAKNAIKILGGSISDIQQFMLGDNIRKFVIINKNISTSKMYPRKAGTPSKEPLK